MAVEITEIEHAEQAQRVLVEAAESLAATLDCADIFQRLARLVVPRLADICIIHTAEDDGALRQIQVAHRDPAMEALLHALAPHGPTHIDSPDSPLARTLRDGSPQWVEQVTEASLQSLARDEEHLRLLRALQPSTCLLVPLIACGRVHGGMTLAHTGSRRRFGPQARTLAQDLARHAALAVHNARLHAAVQQQARSLTAILSASTDDIHVFDREGRYRLLSAGAARALGRTTDEIVGKTPRELGVPAEIWEPGERHRRQVMASGIPQQHERCIPSPRGLRYIEHTMAPIHDAAGAPDGVISICHDITEHRRSQEALQQSQMDLRLALSTARASQRAAERAAARTMRLQSITAALSEALTPAHVAEIIVEQGVAALEADSGLIVLASEDETELVLVRAIGMPAHQLERYRRIPVDASLPLAHAVRTREPILRTAPEAGSDGRAATPPPAAPAPDTRDGQATAAIPLVVEGRALGALGLGFTAPQCFHDEDRELMVTLARQCAQALERARLYEAERIARMEAEAAQHRFALLAEASAAMASSPDYEETLGHLARLSVPRLADLCAVDILDEDRTMRRLALVHHDPAKLALIDELDRRVPPDAGSIWNHVQVLRTGRSVLCAHVTDRVRQEITGDPEHLEMLRTLGFRSIMSVPVKARGRTFGVLSLALTEAGRCYGPADLALAEDLAGRAALAMDIARLYQESREANRLKDEFLATVSHELRTPLNAMTGWIHLLRSGALDQATTARGLEILERNAKAQSQIINDILDVSRIITGKLQLEVRPVELAPIIQAAIETVRPAAEAKDIRVRAALDRHTGRVIADGGRLQQVVWNLLSNAIKFTPGGGEVQVSAARADAFVEIRVQDTGQGIRPEFLPHIFERFRQADSSITRAHGGLGLGLAIVRHLVELHGGTIHAESAGPGQGASFVVRLPLAVTSRDGAAAPLHPAHDPGGAPRAGMSPAMPALDAVRVLVVDDDPDTLSMLEALLSRAGAIVHVASAAAAALDRLEAEELDLLISDIGMPGEDGYSLIRRVRNLASGKRGIPAIALTAYARAQDRTRALAAGFHAHVAKPVNPSELVALIASLHTGVHR